MPMTFNDRNGGATTNVGFDGGNSVTQLTSSFLKGKCYRAFKEFTANTQLRFVATKPFLLTSQSLYLDAGACRGVITVGSTPGGTFTALPTKFAVNGVISPAPTPDVVVSEGGTIAGGTVREVLRTASGAGVGINSSVSTPRLLPAGTYYIQLTITGTTSGIYAIEWTELDAVPV
ncbi:hypothetical protein Laguja5_00001 [Pseudomonas phage vB_PpuP-Laguja-5]